MIRRKQFENLPMKILTICGSPRKGNTYSALNIIKERYSDCEVEILMLKDFNIELCKGCYTCVLRGENNCPLKDDIDRLIGKIQEADGLILAAPVYSQMVPALMKNLFDRLGYLAHRPRFFDKFAMSIATLSGYGAEHALNYMDKMLSVFGFNVVPALELQYKPGGISKLQQEENTQKTVDAFKVLLERIRKGDKDKPTLNRLIPFGIFKAISNAARDTMPADYEYYKEKRDYFDDVKLPFHMKWIAEKIVRKEVSKMI